VYRAGLLAFGAYFCTYAFRKPFTAAEFTEAGAWFGGFDLKTVLVAAQLTGYALAKFIGIRVVAELGRGGRARFFIALILAAELALVGFGLAGNHWSAPLWLFLNGLPLGLVWGVVFSYLEGRRTTELLGAMLSVSFIVSSGAVKTVGAWLLYDVTPFWMPAVTGALFFPPLLACVYGLSRLPPPSRRDIRARTRRAPMTRRDRRSLLRRLGPGLTAVLALYVLLTVVRDLRDNFAAEVWSSLGYGHTPEIFTLAELPVAVLSLLPLLVGYRIRSNRRALRYYHGLFVAATALLLLANFGFSLGLLGGGPWMVLLGLGVYLAYVPLNAIYFDRLIGAFRQVATAGFLIYLADAGGYAGSLAVLCLRLIGPATEWLDFLVVLGYVAGAGGLVLSVYGYRSLSLRLRRERAALTFATH
jgi:MFS family permease